MESIKALHKDYIYIKEIDDECFLAERKGKTFFFRKVDLTSEESNVYFYQAKKLSNAGIKIPKLIGVDKKNGYIISEYIEGRNLAELLSESALKEDIIEQLFKNAFLAKINKMTLNYNPDKWLIKDNVIYYTCPMYINYDKEKDLAIKYLSLYFDTPELEKFLKQKGLFYDKKRLKTAFDVNKEMALITCKYYR